MGEAPVKINLALESPSFFFIAFLIREETIGMLNKVLNFFSQRVRVT